MAPQVVLLRGINLGPNNRIAMPALREALADAGFEDARTYVQSGNIVLKHRGRPDVLAERVHDLIAERFGLDIAVLARTRAELAAALADKRLGVTATARNWTTVTTLLRMADGD